MVETGGCPFTALPEDFLYEIELEDMCEQDLSTWEDLANQKWEESHWSPGQTQTAP